MNEMGKLMDEMIRSRELVATGGLRSARPSATSSPLLLFAAAPAAAQDPGGARGGHRRTWLAIGVVTLSVTQGIREIGVRVALGARSGEVVRGVVREGLGLAVAGIGLGLVAAVPATRALREFLFEIEPTDPLTYASIAVAVALVSGAASYLSARRAAAVDPVKALRTE